MSCVTSCWVVEEHFSESGRRESRTEYEGGWSLSGFCARVAWEGRGEAGGE